MERTAGGVSTRVYRARRGGTTIYVRLAESTEASLAPEALAHRLLRARGVRVPEVIHLESFNEALGRSMMVTAEIPGRPVGEHHPGADLASVLREAGRDLAILNSIAVDGFGWVRRDRPDATRLEAELPTLRAFALDDLDWQLASLAALLTGDELDAARQAVDRWGRLLDAERGSLAHGDLDASHIYHRDGRYTGIIDLGEIRGADPLYDLGHAALHDGETLPEPLVPGLLAGWSDVAPPPTDAAPRIQLWSLLIGIGRLARLADRPPTPYRAHLATAAHRAMTALPP